MLFFIVAVNLHSYHQCRKVPFSLHPLRHLSFVGFLTMPTATLIYILHTLLGPQGRDESICQDPVHLTPTRHQALLTQPLKFLSESSVPLVSPATASGSLPPPSCFPGVRRPPLEYNSDCSMALHLPWGLGGKGRLEPRTIGPWGWAPSTALTA